MKFWFGGGTMSRYSANSGFLNDPSAFMNRSFGMMLLGNGVRMMLPGRAGSGRAVSGS
jgi:hypothetical protein